MVTLLHLRQTFSQHYINMGTWNTYSWYCLYVCQHYNGLGTGLEYVSLTGFTFYRLTETCLLSGQWSKISRVFTEPIAALRRFVLYRKKKVLNYLWNKHKTRTFCTAQVIYFCFFRQLCLTIPTIVEIDIVK